MSTVHSTIVPSVMESPMVGTWMFNLSMQTVDREKEASSRLEKVFPVMMLLSSLFLLDFVPMRRTAFLSTAFEIIRNDAIWMDECCCYQSTACNLQSTDS
mmetsp:Transcript_21452/g.30050  ORF Transcript_21452/g.30050 Transcript_21452/m.30050 type:complete len:100 (-) Transcript_21452:82-381(-)